jgi:S-DNA-T family DNA segregation ATPase FtsK/SpoIIIE
MTDLSIIGRVAASRIAEEFHGEDGPPSRILYGIIDLDADVTCAIAREIASIPVPDGRRTEVFVHPKIKAAAGNPDIGNATVSDETATYHRGNTSPDTALTVFSVPAEDAAAVRQSLAHVSVINSDWLTDDMKRWAAAAMPAANDVLRTQLANVLTGIKRAGVVSEIAIYAAFLSEVEALRTGSDSLPIPDAVRRALPALRLPRGSGDPRLAIEQSPEKAEAFFRKVFDEVRPALYLRNKDGESLNVIELRNRLDTLVAEEEIGPAAGAALGALLANPNVGSGDWLPEQEAVARLAWEQTETLFSESKKKVVASFGEDTLKFFADRHPGVIGPAQEEMLKNLKRDSANISDIHNTFFNENATRLADDPKLFRRWEKLIYRKPVEADDLQEGLLRLVRQTMQNVGDDQVGDPAVVIRLRRGHDLNFWTVDKNTRVCRYLRDRYRGLDKLLADDIVVDFGRCWSDWDRPGLVDNASDSKVATSLEFEAFYVEAAAFADGRLGPNRAEWDRYLRNRPKAQMVWTPEANALGLSYSDDVQVLCRTGEAFARDGRVPLLRSSVSANRYDKHGSMQTIDLDNQSSINDARHDSNGHLANDALPENLIDPAWRSSLDSIRDQGIISPSTAADVLAAYEDFSRAYGDALKAIASGDGLADPALVRQAVLFGELLSKLKAGVTAPLAIRELWSPLLQIGCATVNTDRPAALVSGWSPFRIAESAVKAAQLARAMRDVLHKSALYLGEMEAYVRDTVRNLSSTYYQDVTISAGHRPELLVETVRSFDVSLMESPNPGDSTVADEPADDVAANFDVVAQDYLKLRPHEKANFSTMLYNSEAESLPVQIAGHMAALIEKEPSLRCELVLTHDDAAQLRRIYEQQNRRIGYEVENALANEASRTLLSRLRVGIIGPDAVEEKDRGGKGDDIVVLHGVVSRKADVRWAKVGAADGRRDPLSHVPVSHSRKKPFHRGDTSSGTFLTSPDRVPMTQSHLDAVHACVTGGALPDDHWMPMQEVEFQTGAVRDMMAKAHGLAEWVMTYDRIADRRLLASDDRRILRYYSSPRSDHNVIISTEINAVKLGERLGRDLRMALPSAEAAELSSIVSAIHRQSASLSGAVVMRGAERVNHAHELLGLVLARRELESLLQVDTPPDLQKTAWFFIDDYLQWLDIGQPRADIMSVNFAIVGGRRMVRIAVGEAKFVSLAGVNEHKRHSLEQLASTVAILTKRLVSEDGTIDPLAWRSKIADLVLEHIDPFDQIGGVSFEEWLSGLREGSLPITVSGHSLVYIHDMDEDPKREPMVPDSELHPKEKRRLLAQWSFGRPSIAAGFRDLVAETSPARIHLPPDWPTNPYAAPSEIVPPTSVDLPKVIEHIEEFAVANDPEGTDRAAAAEPLPRPGEELPAEPVIQDEVVTADRPPADAGTAEEEEPSHEPKQDEPVPPGWLPTVWNVLAGMRREEQMEAGEAWLAAQAVALRDALQSEGQQAAVLETRLTPNSAILTLDGTKGVTVAWLEKNVIFLRTRYGIDIGRITPLTMKIAVTVNRPKREVLHLSEAWRRRSLEPSSPVRNGPLVVGDKELDGELLYLPLYQAFGEIPRAAPHSLVSGSTGSGKGILATNLILDLCAFNSPDDLRLYLIDPKNGLDYQWIKKMPHLEGGIISDKELAVETFRGLVAEMNRRELIIGEAGAANLTAYHRLPHQPVKLPRIALFHDEVANWMLDDAYRDDVDGLIDEIATRSRAAGIHIFMIYQRADNQVMSMQLRTNLGNRLILRLNDEGSSRIALGEKGAEKLLGLGHLIAKIDGGDKVYAQVPFLHPEGETAALAEAIIDGWRARSAGGSKG